MPGARRRPLQGDQQAASASVVTDRIETFTERGLKLASGAELEADVIVTATGLNLLLLGGMAMHVDGREVDLSQTVGYKGMMFSGVPNLALALGYTNASWTLKGDLMRRVRLPAAEPHGRARLPQLHAARARPLDCRRSRSSTSRPATCSARSTCSRGRGSRTPWRLHQNYARDILLLKRGPLEDEGIEFSRAGAAVAPAEPVGV